MTAQTGQRPRFAVFASGSGSNLQAIIDATEAGRIGGTLALVVTNRPGSGAQQRAQRHDLPVAVVDHKAFASREAFEAVVADKVDGHAVEWIVLAGFMRVLTPGFVRRYAGRIVNTHPSLLPAFRGAHAIDDALAAGVDHTGVTIHLVDEGVDTGPIVAQEPVAVRPDDTRDTLRARIQAVEHRLFPQVIDRLLRDGPPPS